MRRAPRLCIRAIVPFIVTGCTGVQSSLETHSPQAARIADLWWLMFGLGTLVFIAVMIALGVGLMRARREGDTEDVAPTRSRRLVLVGGVAVPMVIVVLLVVYSVSVGAMLRENRPADAVTIDVTGHQFWWEIRYPGTNVVTANELHIPAGEPIRVRLTTADVIHSFWVPNLHGKIDMLPGRVNEIWFSADSAGVFRGQCAEFCGVQHTFMAFEVVAHPRADYEAWLQQQQHPAPPPATVGIRRGEQLVQGSACVYCHRIDGTNASGRLGPDLTHFASRRRIAAGILPNTRGNLAAWLVDPQSIKPGNKMPPTNLSGPDLQAMLDYLYTLR